MKKFLLISILLLFFGILVWVSYQIFPEEPKKTSKEVVEKEKVKDEIPSEIPLKDFRSNALETNSVGEMLLADEKDYQIVYFEGDQSFIITLYTPPIPETQQKAEEALLRILGVTKNQACKLNVSLGVPYQVDPQYIGVSLPLSFCE